VQSASVAQLDLHAMGPHAYEPHDLVAPSHVPLPVHLPVSVSVPPLTDIVHALVPHEVAVVG
jgi:hypothetical protein